MYLYLYNPAAKLWFYSTIHNTNIQSLNMLFLQNIK